MGEPCESLPARGRAATVSVIAAVHNEGEHLGATGRALRATLPPDAEIIVVDDASTDGGAADLGDDVRVVRQGRRAGLASSRNAGAHLARGDVLVFVDGHVTPVPGWTEALCDALARPGVGLAGPVISAASDRRLRGYGFTWADPAQTVVWLARSGAAPYRVPFLGGGVIAVRAALFRALGGFDAGMRGWGSEDAELALRAWVRGLDALVVPAAEVAHVFREDFPYRIGWPAIVHNRLRLAELHLTGSRLAAARASLAALPGHAKAQGMLDRLTLARERSASLVRRARGDAAFFARFRIGAA
jgi:GT2 family glycosyltransferase